VIYLKAFFQLHWLFGVEWLDESELERLRKEVAVADFYGGVVQSTCSN
jgi:hypothetical protein